MLEGVYDWVLGIACYMILVSVLNGILPAKKYVRYLRLVSGLILILLVLEPILGKYSINEKLASEIEAWSFKNQSNDFGQQMEMQDVIRMNQMIANYENAVANDIDRLLCEQGIPNCEIEVTIDENRERETFGSVIHIHIVVPSAKKEEIPTLQKRLKEYYNLEADDVEMECR